ncbi:WD40 repeat domain-containing protein, partial [Gelidibacter salicanalis]
KAKFSPKGGKIMTTGEENNIKIWDVKSGEELHLFNNYEDNFVLRSIFSTAFDNVIFTPDEKKIVTSSFSNVLIWNAETGDGLKRIRGYSYSNPLISVDGSKLITTSKNE